MTQDDYCSHSVNYFNGVSKKNQIKKLTNIKTKLKKKQKYNHIKKIKQKLNQIII